MGTTDRRLVVVANRLPVQLDETGEWETSPGGLVSALAPLLKGRGGAWVGWAGVPGVDQDDFQVDGIDQVAVPLTAEEEDGFYHGFCNGTLWPLYHDAVRPPEFHRTWWATYVEVNRRFAEKAAAAADPGDVVWVHDYQLQLVPAMLRSIRSDVRIGFFLHIPFPPVELYSRLPWRRPVVEGLLGADMVAFQTRKDAQNFVAAARRFAGVRGADWRRVTHDGREVRVDRAPIGIDVATFQSLAAEEEVHRIARDLRERAGNPRRLVLGVDRLDYTKGIDVRLRAFQTVLERQSLTPEDVQFLQIAVPSREAVPLYQETREEVERLVGQINGENARTGLPVVHYLYRSFGPEDLVGAYLAADIMMVTPLRDGMNLVAKEYVASRVDDTGVLVLSEFAGASEQLRQALVVNPHDVDHVAATLIHALEMDEREQRRRMRALRRVVNSADVFEWAETCLAMMVDG